MRDKHIGHTGTLYLQQMTLVSTNVAVFKQKVPKVLRVQFFAENYFQLEVLQVRIDDT